MPQPTNLFTALIPQRSSASVNQPKSFGREDYLTAAVASVWHADAHAKGSLCRDVLNALFGIRLEGPLTISMQQECAHNGKRTSYIDLHITTPHQAVFLEHKTGTRIGERVDASKQHKISQLALYQAELDALSAVADDQRHLCMLTWAPTDVPTNARYWRGARYWWDLYTAIAGANASPSSFAEMLRQQLLEFLRELQLDPPTPITPATVEDSAIVQRILALSLERACAKGAQFFDVRPASWGAYLVRTRPCASGSSESSASGHLDWAVGFWAGVPEIRCANRGYLVVDLPENFYRCDVDTQVALLAEGVWPKVAAGQGIVRQLPRMSRDVALDRFGSLRGEADGLLSAAQVRGWKIYVGAREIVISKRLKGETWKVKLDSWNKGGANVRVETPGAQWAETLKASLGAIVSGSATEVRRELLLFRLAKAVAGSLPGLLEHAERCVGSGD